MRGGESRNGDPIGTTAHIVETQGMEPVNRIRVPPMLPTGTEFEIRIGLSTFGARKLYQPAHPLKVEAYKWVDLKDAFVEIFGKKAV